MADSARTYRRWLWRHLLMLAPAAGGAAAVMAYVAISAAPLWVGITCLASAALLGALPVYLLTQMLACARLHATGRRREAHLLRRHLGVTPAVAFVCLFLLAALVPLPGLFREPAAPAPDVRVARETDACLFTPTTVPPVAAERLTPRADPPPPRPAAAVEETEPTPPGAEADAGTPPRDQETVVLESQEEGRVRPKPLLDDFRLLRVTALDVRLERVRMPDELDPENLPPSEASFDMLLLIGDDEARGGGGLLTLDLPFIRSSSLRVSYLFAMLFDEDTEPSLRSGDGLRWQRVTTEYECRLLGYTRHAAFDLAFSIGLSVDTVDADAGDAIASGGRLAPYVAIDAALWQTGPVGLLLHLGQSIPVNLTGASASVTDVAATLRIDLGEHASIRLGYRAYRVEWRDYSRALGGDSTAETEMMISGPFVGLDLSF